MPLTRAAITEMKRQLIAARSYVQDAKAKARRGGDADLAERLHDIAERVANELDYLDMLLARLP
jgi:hypothetical protein